MARKNTMALKRSAAQPKKVQFAFEAPNAKSVTLAGSFNNWNATATQLKKGKGKIWKKDLSLKPGRYEYKFVVDGNWTADPKNNNRAWSSLGTENSVIEV